MPRSTTAIFGALALATTCAAVATATEGPGGYEYDQPSASANPSAVGILSSRRRALLGRSLAVKGTVEPRFADRPVVLQRLGRDGAWTEVTRTVADAQGAFRATWATDHIGRITLRAIALPSAGTAAAAPPTAPREVTIFRPARATYYGPGFYGRRTACGQRMTPRLLGVAHRTLRCGTRVDLFYGGRVITVPVVDRGPFRAGTSWDLTMATARALRFTFTDTIGAVRVRADRSPRAVSP